MKTNQWSKLLLTGCLLLLCAMVQAQYKYKANLTSVDTTGFYRITLPPKVVGKCLHGQLTDLRIVDDKGQAVPYISQKDLPVKYKGRFIDFESLPPSNDTTALLLKSPPKTLIQQIYLVIKNNNVQREVNISGSDDGKEWFVISEKMPLSGGENNGKGYFEYPLTFPPSNYQYYNISVSGKDKNRINILKAGYYKNDLLEGNYDELPAAEISQKDTAGTSSVLLKFDDRYIIDKLHVTPTGAKYYHRLIFFTTRNASFNIPAKDFTFFSSGILDSKNNIDFVLGRKTETLLLTIQNEDSPPLKVTSATAYQLRRSVLCYLEAGRQYHLTFGDPAADIPHYDLAFFTDSITNPHNSVKIGPIENNQSATKLPAKADFNFTYLLWVAIGVVLLALAFFTYKMANEVKSRNS